MKGNAYVPFYVFYCAYVVKVLRVYYILPYRIIDT